MDYPDTTPDITYAYDRLGRKKTVTDAVGTRTFSYDATDLALDSEDIKTETGDLYSKTIERDYDAKGRDAGFHIGSEYNVDYDYDDYGRLDYVKGPGMTSNGVTYLYAENSDLIEWTVFKDASGNDQAGRLVKYESNRSVINYVENGTSPNLTAKTFGSTLSKYDYTTDALGRRTDVAFSSDYSWITTNSTVPQYIEFGYNDRSELTAGDRYTDAQKTTHMSSLYAWDYVYDNIGNRKTYDTDDSGSPMSYTRTVVNEYASTSNPAETFSHDHDGNLTSDATLDYTWDYENRLIRVTPKSPGGGSSYYYQYEYDYMGRLVAWYIYMHDGSGHAGAFPNLRLLARTSSERLARRPLPSSGYHLVWRKKPPGPIQANCQPNHACRVAKNHLAMAIKSPPRPDSMVS